MRNLQVFRDEHVKLKLNPEGEGEVIVAGAYDSDHGRVFMATSACNVYSLCLGGQAHCLASLLEGKDDGSPAVLQEGDRIISMEFLSEKEVLVLVLAGGDILQLDPASQEVEVVGAVGGGIVNLALSPDGELLVVATGLGKLLLMTEDWDVLYEMSLDQPGGSSSSAPTPPGVVQISWRGDGKYFSTLEVLQDDSQSPGKVNTTGLIKVWERETGTLHSCGEPLSFSEPALSWSPSGACIVTATGHSDIRKSPVVVLFEKNGLKRGSFEVRAPPEARVLSLQWNANSELLAIVIRYDEWDFIQVWSMRNFHWYLKQEWRYSASEDVKMLWDPEKPLHLLCWTSFGCFHKITLCWKSAVLGCSTAFVIDGRNVHITPLSLSILPPPMFSFKVNFPSNVQTVSSIFENASRCFIAAGLSDGSASVYALPTVESWDALEGTDLSASRTFSDPVLDFGKLRHLTWLNSTTLVGSLSGDGKPNSEQNCVSNKGTKTTSSPSVIVDLNSASLVEFKLLPNNEEGSVNFLEKTSSFSEMWVLKLVHQSLPDLPVAAIAASPLNPFSEENEASTAEAFVQLVDGRVVLYSSDSDRRKLDRSVYDAMRRVKFASPSPWMEAIYHSSLDESHVVLIGLEMGGRLQVDDQMVSQDCTGFTIHESNAGDCKVTHLVFTTKGDTMHVINLEEILAGDFSRAEVKDISSFSHVGKGDHPTTLVGRSRARMVNRGVNTGTDSLRVRSLWERGAQLVSTIGGTDVAVILQTVRGNLETIYPRGLVLGAIATALTHENFQDALLLSRRHHINPNVLVDYKGWKEFSRTSLTFVKQVQNLSHVTEVIQALMDENVMNTTYKNLIPIYQKVNIEAQSLQSESSSESKGRKVPEVLRAIRTALEKEIGDSPARELCILTTLACSDPPELGAALGRIKALREAEVQGIKGGGIVSFKGKLSLSAEAAVKHLIWLSDADSVFSAALGLYDLHLAAMVASNSQKDPKEFLPLLEELGNMPLAQMRYSIDCRLGNYESALRNCSDMRINRLPTCIELVTAHPKLFPSSLQMFKDGEERNVLLDAWGDHLVEERKFEDAGAAFSACSNFEKALAAYKRGGLWESAMAMVGRLRKSPTETLEIASELRDELQAMGMPKEAAKLALDYCRDIEGAISLLLEAHEWLEVSRLAYLHERGDLVSLQLEPAVLECASTQSEKFQEDIEKVGKYLARFLAVHKRRELLAAKLNEGKEVGEKIDDDASSDISLASSSHSNISGLSAFSAYTHGTVRTQSATISTSASGKGRRQQGRAQKYQGGRIRAGSPHEELALAEHLKGMALESNTLGEQRLLLQALLQLGFENIALRLQLGMSHFISVQEDAVRQTELTLLEYVDNLTGQNGEETPISVPAGQPIRPLQRAPDVSWQWEILK